MYIHVVCDVFMYIFVCMGVHKHVFMGVCEHVYMQTCIYIHVHVYVQVHELPKLYSRMCEGGEGRGDIPMESCLCEVCSAVAKCS